MNHREAAEEFVELLAAMARLRGEQGCPWDKEQTHETLRPFLLEETHEALEALRDGDPARIREELGDVLHQIVFHCQLAAEKGEFTAADVIRQLREKMVRRHPHVFSGEPLRDSAEVIKRWADLKADEKETASASILGNLPRSLPALARAQAVTERASRVGFDWPAIDPVWDKLEEEFRELRDARASGDKTRIAEELGDLFFALVNLSRFLGLQAEDVLTDATERFIRRFRYIEARLREAGSSPACASPEELDRLWEEAKSSERSAKNSA
ncbi:MAG TPA: nucleoside triphosphate pyrophosphohydrolase [candidate division Zixibacteria bacterium]|nr:nucleoside triphosphate pyrophosphohydrolase [candidate division Zixibacteria bacterium]